MIIQPELLKALKLPAMGQLGIVVKKLDQALPYYKDVLNIRTWYRANIVEEEIYYKNRPIELNLNVAIGYSGSLQFELIEVAGGEESIYSVLLDTAGEGLHHLGFIVSDIHKKTEMLRQAGFVPIQYGHLKTRGGAITRFAYFDTRDACGYILELIETTLLGVNVGMSRFMVSVGRVLGDIAMI